MRRVTLAPLVTSLSALLLGALFAGCGPGYSQQDAADYCEIEKANKTACFTDAAFNQCIECLEECGAECVPAATCPATYSCPP
jgi:hypothetical protein